MMILPECYGRQSHDACVCITECEVQRAPRICACASRLFTWWSMFSQLAKTLPFLFIISSQVERDLGRVAKVDCWLAGQFIRHDQVIRHYLLWDVWTCGQQSTGSVWKSRWTSWAPVPNKPTVSVDVKQHWTWTQSSGAVWKSRWTSWAPVPNKPTVSVDVKQLFSSNLWTVEEETATTEDRKVQVFIAQSKHQRVLWDPFDPSC